MAKAAAKKTSPSEAQAPVSVPLGRTTLRWSQIEADPDNPRKHFDDEALDELAANIASEGLLQNLLVRPPADGATHYRLVAGERRWRAIGRAIAKDLIDDAAFEVPVDVRELTDEQAAYLALLENMARKDLKPLEEARHFRLLIDRHGQTTASIAEKTGFTQRFVQQRLQLLELKPGDQARFERGDLTIEQARNTVANYPKPIEISAAAQVLFLEVAHRVAKSKGSFWNKVPVHYEHAEPAAALAEVKRFFEIGAAYNSNGQHQVGFSYMARQLLSQLTGHDDLVEDAIESVLLAAREAAGQAAPIAGPYLTPWLNKPFTCDPAEAEKAAERKRQNEEWEAKNKQARAEQEAKDKARKAVAQEVLTIATNFAAEPVPFERVTDVMARFGHPLPWRWTRSADDSNCNMLDAAGEVVDFDLWSEAARQLMPLVMAAMNGLAGLPPHIETAAPGRDDFEDAIGDAVLAADPEAEDVDAAEVLDAWLTANGLTFGALGTEWNDDLVQSIANDFVKKTAATDPDADIPASLKKLVDGTARPIAEAVEA